MTAEFLGVGWKIPVGTGPDGEIERVADEDAIRQSIWMILATAPGERVMRPDFGCGIHELVFAVNDAGTAGRIVSEVRQALLRWEPRIEAVEVEAVPDAGEPNLLRIGIDYRIRATNSRFNLVYPFYLDTSR